MLSQIQRETTATYAERKWAEWARQKGEEKRERRVRGKNKRRETELEDKLRWKKGRRVKGGDGEWEEERKSLTA